MVTDAQCVIVKMYRVEDIERYLVVFLEEDTDVMIVVDGQQVKRKLELRKII